MYIVEYKIKNKFNIYRYLEKCFFVSFLIRNEIVKYIKKQFKKLKNNKDYNLLLKERKELKKLDFTYLLNHFNINIKIIFQARWCKPSVMTAMLHLKR